MVEMRRQTQRDYHPTAGCLRAAFLLWWAVSAALAATYGTVVPIGGHASDIAIDERRGLVYVANFTANRIEVMSTADNSLRAPLSVPAQPASIAVSPDARYLVIAHFQDGLSGNGVTIVDLDSDSRRELSFATPPLAVVFGADGQALIVTQTDFQLLDPLTGSTEILATIEALTNGALNELTAKDLPVPFATFPPEITRASAGSSGDGLTIYGIGEAGGVSEVFYFAYDVMARALGVLLFTASPELGPRVVSVSHDGGLTLMGWGLINTDGVLLAQFRNALGRFDIGSHAIDSSRGLIYAQIPEAAQPAPATSDTEPSTPSDDEEPSEPDKAPAGPPVLMITDADNLTIRERLRLPENLAGKSALSSSGDVMYSISESGVLVLPIGSLAQTPRVLALQEDVLFRGSFCDRSTTYQDIDIVDPGGGNTSFTLSTSTSGITLSPSSGVTPARVQVSVDFSAFRDNHGTSVGFIEIHSDDAVNIPPAVRVLVNNRQPDQRGTIFNVPGRLVDILADPKRDRFYVLRRDKNLVLAFDGTSFAQVGALRTGNTPWRMAITSDGRFLMVANDDSQIANVFDLDTLQPTPFIRLPGGHYPRSLAASGDAIFAASRVAGPEHTVDLVDIDTRAAHTPLTLGIYENNIDVNTVLAPSPSGGAILVAQADGNVLLYDASAQTFAVSRKDFSSLSGAYGALSDEHFVVDHNVLNRSLVVVQELDAGIGASSGVAVVDGFGVRTASPSLSGPGALQRVSLNPVREVATVRTVESPLLPDSACDPFTRTLAPLGNRTAIVSLTISGFTVFPWDFDAEIAEPRVDSVVNAADGSTAVASGGLVRVLGQHLGPMNFASGQLPLPTVLGDTCVTLGDHLMPMALVSPHEIVGQIPFNVAGETAMTVRSPGGVGDDFSVTVLPVAPSVFHTGTAGPVTGQPAVFRAANDLLVTLSNPIHPEDYIVVYVTGLGHTSPEVAAGFPGPFDPLAWTVTPPVVTLGGVSLPVLYAGMVPGEVGVYQINAFVPYWVPTGMSVPLAIQQAGQGTTLTVRVVK